MFCKNCGNEIRPSQKICTECGAKVHPYEKSQSGSDASDPSSQSSAVTDSSKGGYQRGETVPREPMDSKKRKRLLIILGSVGALLIVLFIFYQVLSNMFSHEHLIEEYTEAVASEDAERLQEAVATDITLEEANAYIRYIDNNMGFSQLEQSANQISNDINNGYGVGSVHDGDYNLLEVMENGKKLGLFDEYSLSIPKHNVLLELPEEVESLQFEFGDNTVEMDTGNTKLAELIPGEYVFDATSVINEENFESSIHVDFSNYYDYETVFAELDLGMYYVAFDVPLLYSWYEINSDDITITVNGEPQPQINVENSEGNVLGPLKYDEEYEVGASLKYEGKEFQSQSESLNVTGSEDLDGDNHYVMSLDFDEEEISEHSDNIYEQESLEMEREMFEADIEYEVESFIGSYFSDLERAYDHRDIVYIEEYIIEGTETYETLNSNFQNNNFPNLTIWSFEIVKFERDGKNIYIEVYSDRLHDDLDESVEEKTAYNILYDDETLTFKIESFMAL